MVDTHLFISFPKHNRQIVGFLQNYANLMIQTSKNHANLMIKFIKIYINLMIQTEKLSPQCSH